MAGNKDDVNLIDFNNDFDNDFNIDVDINDFQDYHTKRNTSPRKIRDNLNYYKLNKNKKKPIYEREKIIIQMPNNIVRDNNSSCCGLAVYAWLCFICLCMCIIICFTLLKIYDKI